VRIAVIALDTRGGVQPYTALGLGLQRAGHDVRMVVPADAVPGIATRGLDVAGLSGPGEAEVREVGGVAEMGARERNRLMRSRSAETGRSAREAFDACAGVDLVTGGIGGMVVGVAAAEKLGLPFVEAHLQPLGPPTDAFPGPLVRLPGRVGRRVSHRLTARGVDLMLGTMARHARVELGLPARPAPPRPGLPVLYGYSPLVVPHPPEWGPDRHVTGYWTLPDGDGWAPPGALTAFLASGPPPVCVGFGSMVGRDPAGLAALVVDAVRRAGVRAILLSGWGGLDAGGSADVLVLDQAPHDWLFPRCAAAVHHGGAGTTGAALGAGVPAVVVPFGVDQPFWASRVVALGAGPRPIPRKRLTAEALAEALRAAVTDEGMRERAAAVGAGIRAEDGVGAAVARYDTIAARLA
jgi:sterol 3beta-glucosyltransferase